MKGIRIRPDEEGLRTSLFDLEAEIMEVVWAEAWDEFSVQQVHDRVSPERGLAYTTIMTTVARLADKGMLRRRKEGRRYLYAPAMTHDEFIAEMTRKVLHSLPPIGRETAVALLVEHVAEADDAELDRLEALLRARRNGGA